MSEAMAHPTEAPDPAVGEILLTLDGVQRWFAQADGGRLEVLRGVDLSVRAGELGIEIVRQGFDDKLPAARGLIKEQGVAKEEVCYIGDDLPDLPVLRYVGVGVAVADAAEEVKAGTEYLTDLPGGHGAVREVLEGILKVQGRWDELVRRYVSELPG